MSDKKVTVDGRNFVYVNGVKICKVNRQRGTLDFPTKNRRGGQQQVSVTPAELAAVVKKKGDE